MVRMNEESTQQPTTRQALNGIILRHAVSSPAKAAWQIFDTLLPYVLLWALAIYLLLHDYPLWLCFIPVLVAAPFLVRIFVIFHDCCHSSFFKHKWANQLTGYLSGILVFTPYQDWRQAHIHHHATAGNLDKRGVGDIWTLTVEEYLAAPKAKRIIYRIFRNPFFLFGFGPAFIFLFLQRFSQKGIQHKGRLSVYITNFGIVAVALLLGTFIGFKNYLMIQLPITIIAATLGLWLFYVQHQYEEAYWEHDDIRDSVEAALQGSSYYKLPKIAQWFTGNIGLHHIHHLNPSIPNYNLQACHNEIHRIRPIEPMGILKSLKSLRIHLWDENTKRLISFRAMNRIRKVRRNKDITHDQ